ncbi:MAG: hypothetical protein U9P36_06045 [Thermodesulfobacteriota bacterium]|nr:hypothetical protein [Thermodesulfobacteriota bacterium]
MKAKVVVLGLIILLPLLFSGCAGRNKMTGSWKDPSFTGPVKGKVLVVGVAHNDTHRRIFEDSLMVNLKAEGTDAVAGYTYEDDGVEPTKAAILAVVKQSGASTVLVTHVAGSEEKSQYFPAIGATFIDPGYYGGLYSYYPMVYNYVYMPAQTYSKEIVTLETGLYDASSGQLIWIGRSDAVNPEMTKKYYTGLTKLFVNDLRKNNLIK